MNQGETIAKLAAMRVIPVLRLATRASAEAAIDCLIEAGFRTVVELTLTTPGAVELIGQLRRGRNADFLGVRPRPARRPSGNY